MRYYKPIPTLTPNQEDRFWSKVEVHQPAGCWEWTAGLISGYGRFAFGQSQFMSHRVAYHLLIGPIPADMQLDHLCRNTKCVNPDHLEVVTQTENLRRGYGPTGTHGRKTHCVHGHKFTPENVRIDGKGSRHCVTCDREWDRIRDPQIRSAQRRARAKLVRMGFLHDAERAA